MKTWTKRHQAIRGVGAFVRGLIVGTCVGATIAILLLGRGGGQ